MATQAPLLTPGTYVQYNVNTQSPRAMLPTVDEQGVGIIRQAFTAMDGPYYQVVWNPGSRNPKTSLYHNTNLTPITQQAAMDIINQMNTGTWQPSPGTAASQYQQPDVPVQAAPPSQQQPGVASL